MPMTPAQKQAAKIVKHWQSLNQNDRAEYLRNTMTLTDARLDAWADVHDEPPDDDTRHALAHMNTDNTY